MSDEEQMSRLRITAALFLLELTGAWWEEDWTRYRKIAESVEMNARQLDVKQPMKE